MAALDLVAVVGEQLERGDLVYEVVRYGRGENDVKYKQCRVVSVERGVCKVQAVGDKSLPVKMRFQDLRMERRGTVTSIRPSVQTTQEDDQVQAWLDMGRSLVTERENELRAITDEKRELLGELDELDALHKRNIEALEAKVQAARDEHLADRKVATQRLDALNVKLAHATKRKEKLEAMIGGKS